MTIVDAKVNPSISATQCLFELASTLKKDPSQTQRPLPASGILVQLGETKLRHWSGLGLVERHRNLGDRHNLI